MGIGAEIAKYYCSLGAEVVVISRNKVKLQAVVDECKSLGAKSANYVSADLSNTEQVFYEKIIQDAVKLLGGKLDAIYLNHILNRGNFLPEGHYFKLDLAHAQTLFQVNYFSHTALAHYATPYLEKTKGRMVIVGSAAGRAGMPNIAMYAGSKHALFGYFESLRVDFAKKGSDISITTCTLGSIGTDNALENVKGLIPDYMWHSPKECGESIVRGGELRSRDVFFPISQTYPVFILRIFPQILDFIVTNFN